ncbi:MAG: hypothetical protein WAW13_00630 [Minisyncoccia bacterium]
MKRLGWVGPSVDRILIVNKTGSEIVESGGENCVVARIQFDNRAEPLGESNLADAWLMAAAPEMADTLDRMTITIIEGEEDFVQMFFGGCLIARVRRNDPKGSALLSMDAHIRAALAKAHAQ